MVQERLVSGEHLSSVLVRFDCAPQGEVHQTFSLDDRLGRAKKKRTDTALSVEEINLLEGQTLGLRDEDCGRGGGGKVVSARRTLGKGESKSLKN